MIEGNERAQVVGLYSFPKSGNTWLRAIICAMIRIPQGPGFMQRFVSDTHFGSVRDEGWHFRGVDWFFYKSHHKEVLDADKDGPLHTDKVIYIYRHPLDVFLSYLNFVSGNVAAETGKGFPIQFDRVEDLTPAQMEQAFQMFLDHQTLFPRNDAFGGVFEHAAKFKARQAAGEKIHILRYEDLQSDFKNQVRGIAEFLEIPDVNLGRVFAAADKRTEQNGKFFWKRQQNNYLNFLTPEQVARFYDTHKAQMIDLGYGDKPQV